MLPSNPSGLDIINDQYILCTSVIFPCGRPCDGICCTVAPSVDCFRGAVAMVTAVTGDGAGVGRGVLALSIDRDGFILGENNWPWAEMTKYRIMVIG